MSAIVANIKWIMIVSGALTCTLLCATVAPKAAVQSTFGEPLEGRAMELVARNWGALIGLIGVVLIYGAYNPPGRPLILIVADVSQLSFIGLVLSQGTKYLSRQAGVAVVADLVMVALFAVYLLAPDPA